MVEENKTDKKRKTSLVRLDDPEIQTVYKVLSSTSGVPVNTLMNNALRSYATSESTITMASTGAIASHVYASDTYENALKLLSGETETEEENV